jgi:hypothetical protein
VSSHKALRAFLSAAKRPWSGIVDVKIRVDRLLGLRLVRRSQCVWGVLGGSRPSVKDREEGQGQTKGGETKNGQTKAYGRSEFRGAERDHCPWA